MDMERATERDITRGEKSGRWREKRDFDMYSATLQRCMGMAFMEWEIYQYRQREREGEGETHWS